MKIISQCSKMLEFSKKLQAQGQTLALVPTMGYLHEGHLSLIRLAKEKADQVILSIYVNPKQFGPHEDFEKYPRNLAQDLSLAQNENVDIVFTPNTDDIYSIKDIPNWKDSLKLSEQLCGALRPGHFEGVTAIVSRLFKVTEADFALFGEKDFQQLCIIKNMNAQLGFKTHILSAPIIREANGLAMSSRNKYLNPKQKEQAGLIYQALQKAQVYLESSLDTENSGIHSSTQIVDLCKQELSKSKLIQIEYVSIVDSQTLKPISKIKSTARLLIACRVAETRLIDNKQLELRPSHGNLRS